MYLFLTNMQLFHLTRCQLMHWSCVTYSIKYGTLNREKETNTDWKCLYFHDMYMFVLVYFRTTRSFSCKLSSPFKTSARAATRSCDIRISFCGFLSDISMRSRVSISCAGLHVVLEAWICERAGVLGHSLMQLFPKPWDISTRFCSFCPPDPVTTARSHFSFAVLKRHFFISLFSSCTQILSRVLTALDWSLRSSGLLYFLSCCTSNWHSLELCLPVCLSLLLNMRVSKQGQCFTY